MSVSQLTEMRTIIIQTIARLTESPTIMKRLEVEGGGHTEVTHKAGDSRGSGASDQRISSGTTPVIIMVFC